MKKLLVCLMALVMIFTTAAVNAEEPPALALQTKASVSVNRDFVALLAGNMTGTEDAAMTQIIGTLLDVVDDIAVRVTYSEDSANLALVLKDTDLATLDVQLSESGIAFLTNLLPNYALSLRAEDIGSLLSDLAAKLTGGAQIDLEKSNSLITAVTSFIADCFGYAQTTLMGVESTKDENGVVTLALTNAEVADFLKQMGGRMLSDEVISAVLLGEMIATTELSDEEALAALQAQLQATLDALYADADTVVAVIKAISDEETGNQTLVLTTATALITVDVINGAAGQAYDFSLVISTEVVEDWNALFAQDTPPAGISAFNLSLDMSQPDALGLSILIQLGDTVLSANVSSEGFGFESPDFVNVTTLTVGMMWLPVASIRFETAYVPAPEAATLENINVMDALSVNSEGYEALSADLQANGLPVLMQKLQELIPEEMALIMNMMMPQTEPIQ